MIKTLRLDAAYAAASATDIAAIYLIHIKKRQYVSFSCGDRAIALKLRIQREAHFLLVLSHA